MNCPYPKFLLLQRDKDLHAVIPSSALHHLGMNPQAT
jgi:hypothetical protein